MIILSCLVLRCTSQHSSTQIRYIALVCNHKKHVESACDLVLHLLSPNFSEITSAIVELKRMSILSTIWRLSTNDVPLWRLATLLDERWMDEDVFNALTEILYFKHQATTSSPQSPHSPAVPSCLFLPTSFLADARRYYQSKPQQYTMGILDLRQRLLLSIIQSISITSVLDNHYTAYVYHVGSTITDHGIHCISHLLKISWILSLGSSQALDTHLLIPLGVGLSQSRVVSMAEMGAVVLQY